MTGTMGQKDNRERLQMIHRIANCIIGIFLLAIVCCLYLAFHHHGVTTVMKQPDSIEIVEKITDVTELENETNMIKIADEADGIDAAGSANADYVGYTGISLQMDNGSVLQSIKMYVKYDKCYFFLPTYAPSCRFALQYNEADYEVSIDGQKIASGEPIAYAELGKSHALCVSMRDIGGVDALEGGLLSGMEYSLEFMLSENLPVVFIETANGTMEYLHQEKTNKEAGKMVCILPDGKVDSMGELSMHARGSSSFEIAGKKSYKITMDAATDILSLGEANKWVLQANALDSTKSRNGVAYEFIRSLRLKHAIDSAYVDVYFNGEYGGNYLLCEPVEVATGRVEIDDEGSYLLVIDRIADGDSFFLDQYETTFLIRYPEETTDEDIEWLRTYINDIEERIRNCDTWGKYQELQEYIDIESFVHMYLINMITNETDANAASTFYYVDGSSGKLFAGPAWDYDRAWGNAKGRGSYRFNAYWDGIPEQLSLLPWFQQELRESIINSQDILAQLKESADVVADIIRASVNMEEIIYGDLDSGFVETGDFDTEIAFLKFYIAHRVDWLCDIVLNMDDYHRVIIRNEKARMTYWVKDGETIPSSELAYLYEVHDCDSLAFENGTLFWDGYPVLSDIELYAHSSEELPDAETVTQTGAVDAASGNVAAKYKADKENWGMGLLTFIIVLAPGFIVLFISMDFNEANSLNALPMKAMNLVKLAVQYFCYDFFILLFAYGCIYLVKGSITLSLSGAVGYDFDYTIYHVNVVFLIMLLELAGACALGCGIRVYRKMKGKSGK